MSDEPEGVQVDSPVFADAEMTDLLGELERSIRRAREGSSRDGRRPHPDPAPLVHRSTSTEYRAVGIDAGGMLGVGYHGYSERAARLSAAQFTRHAYDDVHVQVRTVTTVTTRTPWEQHR